MKQTAEEWLIEKLNGQSTDFWVKYDSQEDCFEQTFNTNEK